MSLAIRLNAMFIACTLLLAMVLSGIEFHRAYQRAVQQFSESTAAVNTANPALSFYLQRGDIPALERALEDINTLPSAGYIVAYDALGEKLAESGASPASALPFADVRRNLSTTENSLSVFTAKGQQQPPGTFNALQLGYPDIYRSIPVFSLIKPQQKVINEADLGIALTRGQGTTSDWVIGYLHFVADNRALVRSAGHSALRVFFIALSVMLACAILNALYIRYATRPLRQISAAARRFATGDFSEPLMIKAAGEIGDLALKVDDIRGSVKTFETQQSLVKSLLTREVNQRTQEVSERDVALQKAEQEAIQRRVFMQRLANYDRLTHLPNRQLFAEQLTHLLRRSQRRQSQTALLLIDLGNYKQINEAMGLGSGDVILREVARRLGAVIRAPENAGQLYRGNVEIAVSRLGGTEFSVVLDEVESAEAAQAIARCLVETLMEPLVIESTEVTLTPRIGAALTPADATDPESLLRAASIAKAQVENTDNGHVLFFNNDLKAAAEHRQRLEADLRHALANNELSLHYQPQIDVLSGSVMGAEALLRWNHAQLGMIPPTEFIKLAEEIGVMEALGDWVLVEACRQMREFATAGLKLPRIAINVSALQFNARFARRVNQVVVQQGIRPSQLELALSESIMTSNAPETVEALQALKQSGIYLSVDDFGSGCSPLNYLGHFPLDELKISRKYLRESLQGETAAKLVAAIVSMAQTLELNVLATGVETPGQLQFLRRCGAHLVQGYLFCEPVSAAELKPMLKPWHFIRQIQEFSAQRGSIRIA